MGITRQHNFGHRNKTYVMDFQSRIYEKLHQLESRIFLQKL